MFASDVYRTRVLREQCVDTFVTPWNERKRALKCKFHYLVVLDEDSFDYDEIRLPGIKIGKNRAWLKTTNLSCFHCMAILNFLRPLFFDRWVEYLLKYRIFMAFRIGLSFFYYFVLRIQHQKREKIYIYTKNPNCESPIYLIEASLITRSTLISSVS